MLFLKIIFYLITTIIYLSFRCTHVIIKEQTEK